MANMKQEQCAALNADLSLKYKTMLEEQWLR